MKRCAITPYEGTEPYIFISYAHKDAAMVYPVLEELDRRGYRVWYDDGIAPGSEWPENIAQHLSGCALTLAFISPNSIASDNCRREITFALSKRKPFLSILLQPTEMSPGMEMQLSAQQCVMKYTYPTEEDFFRKVCSCPDLAPCLKPKPKAEPKVPEQPKAETPSAPPAPPVQKAAAPKKKEAKKPNKKRWMILGGAAALVVLLCVLIPLLNRVKIAGDEVASKGDHYVYIDEETIDQKAVQQINKLNKLSNVVFDKCTFERGALTLLALPENMRQLELVDCTGVDTLSFLEDLPKLEHLSLENCGITDGMLPELSLTALDSVSFRGNSELTDLSKLKDCGGLRSLDISETKIADLTPAKEWTKLEMVVGTRSAVTDLTPLAAHSELGVLEMNFCAITQLPERFSALRLNQLLLAGARIRDLSPFADCTVLTTVNLSGTLVTDLAVLSKSAATLKELNVSNTYLNESALQFLTQCPELKALYMDGVKLKSLQMLANASKLTTLYAADCGIEDLSGLVGCTLLNDLRLAKNNISEVSALRNLNPQRSVIVDLGYNPLTDLSALPNLNYTALSIISDQLDISTLPTLTGTFVLLNYSQGVPASKAALETFSRYGILGCPADQRVALEESLSSYRITYLDTPEAIVTFAKDAQLNYEFLR